ncbi:MAG: glycosyltransferase family 39 protein [Vicingaceae bacterium]
MWYQIKKKDLLLCLIFLVGSILRIYGFWSWSFTNDELSALSRTNYDSFSSLIENGIKPDGHPALVQVFLFYWVKIIPVNEFWIRLPFVLAGILALPYWYLLLRNWINKNAAILSTAIFACCYPLVLYSQIARPYSFGLFFVIGFAYYWHKLATYKTEKKTILGFILFGIAGLVTHYFSALQICLLLLFGLKVYSKKQLKHYLLASLAIVLLFVPHLGITIKQLSIGGLSWLPVAESGYIFRFLKYAFNESSWFKTFVLFIPIFTLTFGKIKLQWKNHKLLFLLFIFPYLLAYFYSIHIFPLLQFSILIFSFPFLIGFLVSFISTKTKVKRVKTYSLFILIIGTYTLQADSYIYSKKPFADFKGVANKIIEWTASVGEENIQIIGNASNATYLTHYLKQGKETVDPRFLPFDSAKSYASIASLFKGSKKEYTLVVFAGQPMPPAIHEFVREKYPLITKKFKRFNAEAILYKDSTFDRKQQFETVYESYKINKKWRVYEAQLIDSIYVDSAPSYQLVPGIEYALTYRDTVKNLVTPESKYLTASASFISKKPVDVKLVMSINYKGKELHWQSSSLKKFHQKNQWSRVVAVLEIPNKIPKNAEVVIFFWNPNQSKMLIDDFKIINFADSDYDYYQF